MTFQRRPNLGARFCVPTPNRKVAVSPIVFSQPPTTNDFCATRRETHRPDGVVVPAQRRPEFCLCLYIKELDLIRVGSCDLGAVRGKSHTIDI